MAPGETLFLGPPWQGSTSKSISDFRDWNENAVRQQNAELEGHVHWHIIMKSFRFFNWIQEREEQE